MRALAPEVQLFCTFKFLTGAIETNGSARFRRLPRGPRFRIGIRWLGRRRLLCCFRRAFAAEGGRLVPIPYDAQPLEGEKLVHIFNEV